MENQESKSKWDDLARELGAEVSQEIIKREEAVALASTETAASTVQRTRETTEAPLTPLPKRSATDWNSLATDLGLPPSEPEVAPAPEAPRQTTRPEPLPREVRSEPRRRESSQSRRPERADRERRPRREESEHRREHRKPRRDRDERHREPRRFEEEAEREPELRSEPREDTASEAPAAGAAPPEQPPKPTVSLWHKLFGSPAEPAAQISEESAQPDAAAPSDLRDDPRLEASDFSDARPEDSLRSREEIDDQMEYGGTSTETREADELDRGRGRPRRRRGRGRGRGRGRQPEGQRPEGRSPERRHRERPVSTERREAIDEIADDDIMDMDDGSDSDNEFDSGELAAEGGNGVPAGEGAPRSASALARAIPSWDEAIGFIVDSNLQSRPQRRPGSRPGSRDNSSRGRSRGRRKN